MELIIALWHRLIGTSTSSILSGIHSKINKLNAHSARKDAESGKHSARAELSHTKARDAMTEAALADRLAGKFEELIK